MEVRIGDLKPNPFRDLKEYPLDKEQIDKLKKSIARTKFWDNVVVRKNGDGLELAYGHHRIKAMQEVFGKDQKINVIFKNVSDAEMLQMMAADNDVNEMSPAFIRQTVEKALQLLKIKGESRGTRPLTHEIVQQVAGFLGWPPPRVKDAITQITAIKEGIVSRKALDQLPSLRSARAFTATVRKQEVPLSKQVTIAEKLVKQEETVTRDAILDAIEPDSSKQRERDRMDYWKFERFLTDATAKAETLSSMLQHIAKEKHLLGDPEYQGQAKIFWNACSKVFKAIQDIYKGGLYEKTKALLE